ncbi:MAG TPA: hypothetical protein VN541_04750 [Tepidisphaeraceae bacterium]|nr:hypothetical protein [Tepidisphaeraceae bacterium]
MRFKVTGADRTTGELTSRLIEGKTAAEAEAVASFTMLVSEIVPDEPPPQTVPYAVPVANARFVRVNWARGIGLYSGLLRILGFAVGLLGIWIVLASLWTALRSFMSMMSVWYVLSEDGLVFIDGLLLISAAVFMEIVGMIALAVRDMAMRADREPISAPEAGR